MMIEVCIMIIFRHYNTHGRTKSSRHGQFDGSNAEQHRAWSGISASGAFKQRLNKYDILNYVLDQGSILDSKVEVLNHRLKGLCDNVDTDRETYDEKEMVFSIRGKIYDALYAAALCNSSLIRHRNPTPYTQSEAQYGP